MSYDLKVPPAPQLLEMEDVFERHPLLFCSQFSQIKHNLAEKFNSEKHYVI